jgi:hypothetical protein
MAKRKEPEEKVVGISGCLTPAEIVALKRFALDRGFQPARAIRLLVVEGLRNLGYLEAEERATGSAVAA